MMTMSVGRITGKHVLAVLLGFFGIMLAVNMAFLFFAVSTFNGGEGGKAYQAGLAYNETIAAAREQDLLGWSHDIQADMGGEVRVTLRDKNGAPVRMVALGGEIARPVAEKFTRALVFKEIEPGIYSASTGPLDAGNWMVTLAVRTGNRNDAIIYRARKRLWLKPNS
jgi:nitrogen fixation protein FixH